MKHIRAKNRWTQWVMGAWVLCLSGSVWADTNITVDTTHTDWKDVTTCFSESTGDSSGQIDITRTCITNNNNAGSNGFLFALIVSDGNYPNGTKNLGVAVDRNRDGVLNDNDDIFSVEFLSNSMNPSRLVVYSAGSFTPRAGRSYPPGTPCASSAGENSWQAQRSGPTIELGIGYGCLGLSYGNDSGSIALGAFPGIDLTPVTFYNGSTDSLEPAVKPPDVTNFTATAQNQRVVLAWTNPTPHEGVVIFREAWAASSAVPTDGTTYTAASTANAEGVTIVYADQAPSSLSGSPVQTFTDTLALQSGTRYFYRIFNHHQARIYSSGIVPSASGIFVEPTSGGPGTPAWCYSTGSATLMQPVTLAGSGIFFADNNGAVSALQTRTADPATDGTERYRPVQLASGVEGRFPLVPLSGQTGNFILTGDKSGRAYAIRAETGQLLWTANGGNPLGDRILAQPGAQLRAFANAAFQSAFTHDLVFIATRNNSTTNNKVYALRGDTGAVRWTYEPGDLDIMSGGMFVDYENNRLWVTARGTDSLRILSTLTGAEYGRLSLGTIDQAPTYDSGSKTVLVMTNAGTVHGYPVNLTFPSPAPRFSHPLGLAPRGYLYPTGFGFIASYGAATTGKVQFFSFSGGTVTGRWPNGGVSVPNPSTATIHFASQKAYVGGSDGVIREIDIATGQTKAMTLAAGQNLGAPAVDRIANRLHIGTLDGRMCAVPVPFP